MVSNYCFIRTENMITNKLQNKNVVLNFTKTSEVRPEAISTMENIHDYSNDRQHRKKSS